METSTSDRNGFFAAQERYSMDARLIFAFSFILSLFMLLAARVTPSFWHDKAAQSIPHKSIFAEAKASAQTCVAFAFMG